MLRYRLSAGLVLIVLASPAAMAVEPYLEFLHGLRERRYYDLALSYLQQIEEDPQLPADVREVLPYEKGVTLLQGARLLKNPEAQSRQLDEAQAMFEQFVAAAPDHPLRGQANTERARIFLNRARVEIWEAEAPVNEGNKQAFRQRARQLIEQARTIFTEARDQHQAEWEKFDKFIPEDQRQLREARAEAEGRYMQAQLDLGRCTYEEAQTYDRGSEKRKELLLQAAAAFEDINHKYRTQNAGLHARMWEAKCFEEQDDIRKALGIYNEILEHRSPSLQDLQDRVRWFRLLCLNHEQREDYQLVVEEATNWRKDAKSRARTDVGLGIQYELAKALEALAGQRTTAENMRANYLNQALNHARTINRYPGPLKAPSGAMIQRLMAALNRDPGDPKDFDTAYGTANLQLEETKKLSGQIDAELAKGDNQQAETLRESLKATAAEMSRLYEMALMMADTSTDAEQVNIARFRLAYGYFLQEKYIESGLLARYVADKQRTEFPEIALESAYVALAASDRVFFEADENDRDFEMQQVLGVADMIVSGWPESDRAVDALTATARIYRQTDEPLKAAEWFAQVPKTSQQYAGAQLSAGQSYWNAYLTRTALPAEQRPPAEELAQWKVKAEEHLQEGVNARQAQLPADADTPDELTLGKLSLVQIRNSEGVYKTDETNVARVGAIELLTGDPHSVLKAVAVPEGQPRPETPGDVQSKAIAGLAYQQLLRAQIGLRDLEAARQTREQLEVIAAAGEDAGALTQVYVEFGRELQKELEQLKASGATERLNDVRAAFESFLGDLFQRKEGQTFNSLLWIAETYTGLAEGSAGEQSKADDYFAKAASTYEEMLNRGGSDPGFVDDPAKLVGVKLRLVNCHRQRGDFAAAEEVIVEILRDRPNALDAQIEAARLYQDWGEQGIGDKAEKLEVAINGREQPAPIWGWGVTAQKLQRYVDYSQGSESHVQKHIDARYNLAKCEYELAQEQTTDEAMDEHLQNARFAIQRFVAITGRLPEEDWQQFDALFREVLADLGEEVQPLQRPQAPSQATAPTELAAADGPTEPGSQTSAADDSSGPSGRSSNVVLIVLLVLAGGGAVVGVYFMSLNQEKKRRAKLAAVTAELKPRKRAESSSRR